MEQTPKNQKNAQNTLLQGFSKKLVFEAIIMSGILALSLALAVGVIIAVITLIITLSLDLALTFIYWIAIGLVPVIGVPMCFVFYRKIYKMSTKGVAQRVDGMGMEQRVITLLELEGSDSFIARKLKEDTEAKVSKIKPKDLKFKFPKWPFIMLGIVFALAVAGLTTQAVVGVAIANRLEDPSGFVLLAPSFENHYIFYRQDSNPSDDDPFNTQRRGFNGYVAWDPVVNANNGFSIVVEQRTTGNNYRPVVSAPDRNIVIPSVVMQNRLNISCMDAFPVGHYRITVRALTYGRHGQSNPTTFYFEKVNRIYFRANNSFEYDNFGAREGYVPEGEDPYVRGNFDDRVVIARFGDFADHMIPHAPLRVRPSEYFAVSFAGWSVTGDARQEVLSSEPVRRYNASGAFIGYFSDLSYAVRNRRFTFSAVWREDYSRIEFLSGNLATDNVIFPNPDHQILPSQFTASLVPIGFALTAPPFHVWGGWMAYGDPLQRPLTNTEIVYYIQRPYDYVRRFISIWHTDDAYIDLRLERLGARVATAAEMFIFLPDGSYIFRPYPISQFLRFSLMEIVDPFAESIRRIPSSVPLRERVDLIDEFDELIGEFIDEFFDMPGFIGSFNLTTARAADFFTRRAALDGQLSVMAETLGAIVADMVANIGLNNIEYYARNAIQEAHYAIRVLIDEIDAFNISLYTYLYDNYNPGDILFIANNNAALDYRTGCICLPRADSYNRVYINPNCPARRPHIIQVEDEDYSLNDNVLLEDARTPFVTSVPGGITFNEPAFVAAVFLRLTGERFRYIDVYGTYEWLDPIWEIAPALRLVIHGILLNNYNIAPEHVIITPAQLTALGLSGTGALEAARGLWAIWMTTFGNMMNDYIAANVADNIAGRMISEHTFGWRTHFRYLTDGAGTLVHDNWSYFRFHLMYVELIEGEPPIWMTMPAFGGAWVPLHLVNSMDPSSTQEEILEAWEALIPPWIDLEEASLILTYIAYHVFADTNPDLLAFIMFWDWLPIPEITPMPMPDEGPDDTPPTPGPPPGNYVIDGETLITLQNIARLEYQLANYDLTPLQRAIAEAQLEALRSLVEDSSGGG